MNLASISIIFLVFLEIGEILSVDYATTCEEIASQCDSPTPEKLDIFLEALHAGGCAQESSVDEKNTFGACATKFNNDVFDKVAQQTNNDQKCKDATDFQFNNEGLIGLPDLLADCNIVGNPLERCFFRCATCIRIQILGFDPTDQFIEAFKACPKNTTSTY